MPDMGKALLARLAIALPLLACGKRSEDPPDAGVDPSCGLDCASQQRYGLIVERCFEYTNPSLPPDELAIGAWVGPVEMLEGGRYVLPVLYSEGGQPRMTDRFFFQDGDLYLARRVFQSGQSITYRDQEGNIVGVPWWQVGTAANQSFEDQVQGDVVNLSTRIIEPTTFRVSTLEPTEDEKTVPAGAFPTAIKLLFSETPEHGSDTRRVFAEGTGFTLFAGPLQLGGGEAVEVYRLLRIRDVGTTDGGSHPCGVIP
jgi:hypothetical protein